MTRFAILVILAAASLPAQPGIAQNGVVNEASQIPPTLAGGALARGAHFTIYGVRLGSNEKSTSISIGAIPVKASSITPTRIDAIVPAQLQAGQAALTVTVDGMHSKPFPISIVESNPGIYSRNRLGWGPGRIETLDAAGAARDNTLSTPARPGQRIRIATTGLGNATEATVVIGNRAVKVARRSGQDELIVAIPTSTAEACYVPMYLLAAQNRASNVVTVAIQSKGRPCDPGAVTPLAERDLGILFLARTRFLDRKTLQDTVSDEATAVFSARTGQPALSPLLLLPPPGTCTAYTSSMQGTTLLPATISAALVAELEGRGLEAGSRLTISGNGKEKAISRVRGSPGYYRGSVTGLLDPGEVSISGNGGTQVGPFHFTVPAAKPFEWTNRGQSSVIDRAKPLKLHWTGAAAESVIVMLATNVGQLSTAIGNCICVARASAGQFTIPPAMLANIPESVDIPGIPYDQLFLAELPLKPSKLAAQGLTGGAIFSIYASGRVVAFQ